MTVSLGRAAAATTRQAKNTWKTTPISTSAITVTSVSKTTYCLQHLLAGILSTLKRQCLLSTFRTNVSFYTSCFAARFGDYAPIYFTVLFYLFIVIFGGTRARRSKCPIGKICRIYISIRQLFELKLMQSSCKYQHCNLSSRLVSRSGFLRFIPSPLPPSLHLPPPTHHFPDSYWVMALVSPSYRLGLLQPPSIVSGFPLPRMRMECANANPVDYPGILPISPAGIRSHHSITDPFHCLGPPNRTINRNTKERWLSRWFFPLISCQNHL